MDIQAEETHSLQLADEHQQCKDLLQQQQLDHQKEHTEQEATYLRRFHDEQVKHSQREEQLQGELALVKGSFHAYKVTTMTMLFVHMSSLSLVQWQMSLQTGDTERHPRHSVRRADASRQPLPDSEEINGRKRDVAFKDRPKLEAPHSAEIDVIHLSSKRQVN